MKNTDSAAQRAEALKDEAILRISQLRAGDINASLHFSNGMVKKYSKMELMHIINGFEKISHAVAKLMIVEYHLKLGFELIGSSSTRVETNEIVEFAVYPPKTWIPS